MIISRYQLDKDMPKKAPRESMEFNGPAYLPYVTRDRACELYSLVMAEKPALKMAVDCGFDGVLSLYEAYRNDRILELLILLASAYRHASYQGCLKLTNGMVGNIYDETLTKGHPLKMHSACDKILHTDEFSFETSKIKKSSKSYRHPFVFISGTYQKVTWMALIDITLFCEEFLKTVSAEFIELSEEKIT